MKNIFCILLLFSTNNLFAYHERERDPRPPCHTQKVRECIIQNKNAIIFLQNEINSMLPQRGDLQTELTNKNKENNILDDIYIGSKNSLSSIENEFLWLKNAEEKSKYKFYFTPLRSIQQWLLDEVKKHETALLGYLVPTFFQNYEVPLHVNQYKKQLLSAKNEIESSFLSLEQAKIKKREEIQVFNEKITTLTRRISNNEASIRQHVNMCNFGCNEKYCPM